jgi:hypothetical protein
MTGRCASIAGLEVERQFAFFILIRAEVEEVVGVEIVVVRYDGRLFTTRPRGTALIAPWTAFARAAVAWATITWSAIAVIAVTRASRSVFSIGNGAVCGTFYCAFGRTAACAFASSAAATAARTSLSLFVAFADRSFAAVARVLGQIRIRQFARFVVERKISFSSSGLSRAAIAAGLVAMSIVPVFAMAGTAGRWRSFGLGGRFDDLLCLLLWRTEDFVPQTYASTARGRWLNGLRLGRCLGGVMLFVFNISMVISFGTRRPFLARLALSTRFSLRTLLSFRPGFTLRALVSIRTGFSLASRLAVSPRRSLCLGWRWRTTGRLRRLSARGRRRHFRLLFRATCGRRRGRRRHFDA